MQNRGQSTTIKMDKSSIKSFFSPLHSTASCKTFRTLQPMTKTPPAKRPVGRPRKRPRIIPEKDKKNGDSTPITATENHQQPKKENQSQLLYEVEEESG